MEDQVSSRNAGVTPRGADGVHRRLRARATYGSLAKPANGGFRSQPESGRISPITGSRQSLIFGRRCLTMDIHLYPFE